MKKAVIFDLDGTLMNTLEDLCDSTNFALVKNGFPPRSIEEIRRFVGNGVEKLIERAVPNGKNNALFENTYKDFLSHYKNNCENKTRPYEGVCEMLASLSLRKIKLAIVSNKPDAAVKTLRDTFFPSVPVAMGERAGVAKKPAPDMVLAALDELGEKKESSVYVGDSEVDIMTAKNSGLECISVGWGFRTREELIAAGATLICDTPGDAFEKIIS